METVKTLGAIHVFQVPESGWPLPILLGSRLPHILCMLLVWATKPVSISDIAHAPPTP
jgi:hypothetical protein